MLGSHLLEFLPSSGREREEDTEPLTSGDQCDGWEVSKPMEGLPVPPSTTRSTDVFKIKSPRT